MKLYELILLVWAIFVVVYIVIRSMKFGFLKWLFERGAFKYIVKGVSIVLVLLILLSYLIIPLLSYLDYSKLYEFLNQTLWKESSQ
jgi:hypothetical protein